MSWHFDNSLKQLLWMAEIMTLRIYKKWCGRMWERVCTLLGLEFSWNDTNRTWIRTQRVWKFKIMRKVQGILGRKNLMNKNTDTEEYTECRPVILRHPTWKFTKIALLNQTDNVWDFNAFNKVCLFKSLSWQNCASLHLQF